MKRLATTTVTTRPLTAKRLTTIPKRITGLYRFSVASRIPFEVDIGGRAFNTVRTLDVFHEAPMFIDDLDNAAAVDLFNDGELTRMIRIHPAGGGNPLRLRITAHEVMPERYELERRKRLAQIKTPLAREGFVRQMIRALRDANDDIDDDLKYGTATEGVMSAVALTIEMGALLFFTAAPHLLASTLVAAAVCDPSRTYINGALFKNLREVRVKTADARIVGYTSP